MKNKVLSSLLVIAPYLIAPCFISVSPLLAEPASRGRLPDGRAYRSSDDGLRLSDYIAELEVTNDDLRRQVEALSSELDEKTKRLEKSAPLAASKLSEKDLSLETSKVSTSCPALSCPTLSCPELSCPKLDSSSYEAKISELSERSAQLKQELSAERARVFTCDYNAEENPWKAKAERLEQGLEQVKTAQLSEKALLSELEQEREKTAQIEDEADKLKEALRAKTLQVAELNQDLLESTKALDQTKREARAELAKTKEELQNAELAKAELATQAEKRASLSTPSTKLATAERTASVEEPNVLTARAISTAPQLTKTPGYRSETNLRAVFGPQLSQIEGSIVQRKNLIDRLKASGKGISIRIQPLVTKQGVSLDSYRAQIQKDGDPREIRNGLSEIQEILAEDIAVLSRLQR